jgi:hypothetical protein
MWPKRTPLAAVIILLSLGALADHAAGQANTNYIGIFGGQNRATLDWGQPDSRDQELSTRTSAVFGGVLGFGLGGNLDLKLEPSYVRKGADREFEALDLGLFKSSYDLSYVDLPVLVQFSFNKGGINPYLLAGGTASYLLKAEEQYGDEYLEFGYETSCDIKDNLKNWDYGYSYGAGLSIPFSGFSLFAEGRYYKGLNDIYDIEDDDTEIFTEGMEYYAGLTFPIGQGADVFFGRKPGAPGPKKEEKKDTGTRTRERKGECEIGAELGIRILNPLGRLISGRKKILFNVIKLGVRVDSNCKIAVQAQNAAVCPYPGTVTFTFYRGEKGETEFHKISGDVEGEEDLKALLKQPAPEIGAPPGMTPGHRREVEFLKVTWYFVSKKGVECSDEDRITIIWRYNGSNSSGTWKALDPDIGSVKKKPKKWRSRVRYNPEIIEERTGFPGRVNHATEIVVDFSVDEAFGCCSHPNKHYAIIQFVRHRWQLGKNSPVRNDAWNLDGPDSQAANKKAGKPYDPTYTTGKSPLFTVGPWNDKGGDAISVRDYPGLFTKDHKKFLERGGFFKWVFWTLLVCLEDPPTAEEYLREGEVQAITHFSIERQYNLKEGTVKVVPSLYPDDRKYFQPCRPLKDVLKERGLLEAYNNPREHEVPIGD